MKNLRIIDLKEFMVGIECIELKGLLT